MLNSKFDESQSLSQRQIRCPWMGTQALRCTSDYDRNGVPRPALQDIRTAPLAHAAYT